MFSKTCLVLGNHWEPAGVKQPPSTMIVIIYQWSYHSKHSLGTYSALGSYTECYVYVLISQTLLVWQALPLSLFTERDQDFKGWVTC